MLLTQVGFNQASTKFYIMELILKYCMYWPDTLQKALKDTHGNLNCYVFLSSVVCSSVSRYVLFYDVFIYFCCQELSRKRVKAPSPALAQDSCMAHWWRAHYMRKLLILMHLNTQTPTRAPTYSSTPSSCSYCTYSHKCPRIWSEALN